MNLPNKLSIARIALIPVFVTLFFLPFANMRFVALGVFVLASVTDFLDGYIARKYNMCTKVGNFLDTIADKMLVTAALIVIIAGFFFDPLDFFPSSIRLPIVRLNSVIFVVIAISAIIIICRELFISGLKMIAQAKGVTIKADKLGKYKMVLQILALCVLIPHRNIYDLHKTVGNIFLYIGAIAIALATILTIISAVNYLIKYKHVFKEEPLEEDKLEEKEISTKEEENIES